MSSYIGCAGILGIVIFIALMFVRRQKIDRGMSEFYTKYSLYTTTNEPPHVRENLGANNNLYCCRLNLATTTGGSVELYWWEWYVKSSTVVNNVPTTGYEYFLAVSFAPQTVSEDFVRKAIRWADKGELAASEKIKAWFVRDTETPYRAEKLADGTLIICWRVLKRRDIYEAKIDWLKRNVIPFMTADMKLLAELHQELFPENSTTDFAVTRQTELSESKIEGISFYTHDNYATLQSKFTAAWTNLSLELNHDSAKFQHDGWDEFDSATTFNDLNKSDEIAFSLAGNTIAQEAKRLFEASYRGIAYILRGGTAVEERETLDYCNNPFRLPLNKGTYSEFKRRFSERWSDLSIELYAKLPKADDLQNDERELAADFAMSKLKHAENAFLGDYVYIYEWLEKLVYVRLRARIKNNRRGIYAEGNDLRIRFKDFQAK